MKKLLILTSAVCWLLLLPAIAAAAAQNLTKITLAHALPQLTPSFAIDSSIPTYLGYWNQEGLAVDVVTTPGGSAATQLVMSGRADAAVASPVTAMLAVQRGIDLRIIYVTVRGDVYGIAIPDGERVSSLKGLKGQTIGVSSFASTSTSYSKALLQRAGLKPTEFTLVEIGVGARAGAAVRLHQVRALGLWDEAYKQMEIAGIKFKHIYKDPRATTSFTGSLIVRGDDLKKRPQVFIGLARAIAKAQLFQQINPEASVKIHWKVYPQSIPRQGSTGATLKAATAVASVHIPLQARNTFGTGHYGDVPIADMTKFQNYLVETGQLPKAIDARKYLSNRLITKINDFDTAAVEKQARDFKGPQY